MDANLLQERENLFAVEAEFKTESHLLADIRRRAPETQLKLNQKNKELLELGEVFAVTLKQIARGDREETALTSIRVKMDGLKVEILNLEDLLDILKKTEVESTVKVGKLGQKVQGATHSFWFQIFEIEKVKIKIERENSLGRAYAALTLSGVQVNFDAFAKQHFGDKFNLDISAITQRLQQDYLGKEKKL